MKENTIHLETWIPSEIVETLHSIIIELKINQVILNLLVKSIPKKINNPIYEFQISQKCTDEVMKLTNLIVGESFWMRW